VGPYEVQQLGAQTPLQIILNALPEIRISGNNLKFQFGGTHWVATFNGENFSTGSIELEDTDGGSILTLKQTHMWPGAAGKTLGRLAGRIPGGSAVGGALDTAGSIAGAAGAIEASGPVIVLQYIAGPPAKLSYLRNASERGTKATSSDSDTQVSGDHPLIAENRFDIDGFNVFAVSLTGMSTFWLDMGGGITLTLFESYKPNVFFTPSYFLSGKWFFLNDLGDDNLTLGAGVLFKHRFPNNRVLWNLGASLEFMWVDVSIENDSSYNSKYSRGSSFLFGMGIQPGFSFRYNPYTSLDLNGFLKFPFGKVEAMTTSYNGPYGSVRDSKSIWPFTGVIELGLTLWFPYRSRRQ
jgi:hypothetical protein